MRHNHMIGGVRPLLYTKQPYFLKNSMLNPYLGSVHDGVSTGFNEGFSVKPIHWLYRFRYNVSPRCSVPMYLRNPGDKTKHWLEVSNWKKLSNAVFCLDCMPHAYLLTGVVLVTVWHVLRYFIAHPDLTLYNIAMYPTKEWLTQRRYDEKHPLDKPSFRWFQRAPEFYCYDTYRELIDMKVIHNDPYIEYMKSIGKEDQLTNHREEGYANLSDLLPYQWRYKGFGKH